MFKYSLLLVPSGPYMGKEGSFESCSATLKPQSSLNTWTLPLNTTLNRPYTLLSLRDHIDKGKLK